MNASRDMTLSPEYAAALEASRVAGAKYALLAKAYRSQKIGDAEFLAGRAAYNEAEKAFDAAYAKAAYGNGAS